VREHEIADAHNDLLLEVEFAGGENPFAQRWLEKLKRGRVRIQICPVAADSDWVPDAALRKALLVTQAFRSALADNRDELRWIKWREDVRAAETHDRLGLMLSLEGAEPLCTEPKLADVFFALGFRLFGLTWSVRNAFADGQGERSDGGLSNLGRELVDRLDALGAVFDLAHASPRTFEQILERTADAPVLVSHAGCRAVYDVPRNLSDEQLRALRERDGVLGVMCIPLTVDESVWTLDRLTDHIDHAVSIMGIDRVCLGSDFVRQLWRAGVVSQRMTASAGLPPGMDGNSAVEDLAGPEDFGTLVDHLYRRGYDEAQVTAITYRNLTEFLQRSLPSQGTAAA
jgi:membrane dipeptidase